MLKLYDYYRSTASYRVRIALNIKNIPYEKIPIHLLNNGGEQYSTQYEMINPQHMVPALQDNQQIITQSLAIMEYINEVYPEPALLPQDAYQKALVRSFALTIIADMHPLNNSRVLKFLTENLHINEEQKNLWYQHWMKTGLTALEKRLAKSKLTSDFCFGDKLTIADICLIPQLFNAKRFDCDTTHYPNLMRINEHCLQLKAFRDAAPQETTIIG